LDSFIRTYRFDNSIINDSKLNIFDEKFIRCYRNVASDILDMLFKEFILTGKYTSKPFNSKEVSNHNFLMNVGYERFEETNFKARWICNIYNQVSGQLKAWLSNLVNYIRDIITKSNVKGDERKKLYYLNKSKKWHSNNTLKSIFRNVLKYRFKKPNLKNISVSLNNNICTIEKSKTIEFKYWYAITKPYKDQKGKLYIPFKEHKYIKDKSSNLTGAMQMNFAGTKVKELCVLGEFEKESYEFKTDSIAIDFGLRNLFTLDNGNMYGKNFIDKLSKWDKQVQLLTNTLKRNGITKLTSNKKYNDLIRSIRSSIENEVNQKPQ
jgi:hypothetical protein